MTAQNADSPQQIRTRIRWQRDAKATGLASVCQGQRFWHLTLTLTAGPCVDEVPLISIVSAAEASGTGPSYGGPYKFCIRTPGEKSQRSKAEFQTIEEAKAAADLWFKRHRDADIVKALIDGHVRRFAQRSQGLNG